MSDRRRIGGITEKQLTRLVRSTYDACAKYLAEEGELAGPLRAQIELQTAARRVVWTLHFDMAHGYAAWRALKKAIGELEAIVGRPEREGDI